MIFTETKFSGVFVIEPEKIEDERGFFARIFDKNEFSKRNLTCDFVQSSISFNKKKGTIRGMHYQSKPYEEIKMVRCTKGKIFDVIIDLREDSDTFEELYSVELSDENYKILYIPKGFAHGFQTLVDDCEIYYNISENFSKEFSKGIRWNDEHFGITWPIETTIISEKDKNIENYQH